MVKYLVANEMPRVRFPDGASLMLHSLFLLAVRNIRRDASRYIVLAGMSIRSNELRGAKLVAVN